MKIQKHNNSSKKLITIIVFAACFITWQTIMEDKNPTIAGDKKELYKLINDVTKAAYEGNWYEIARTPNSEQASCLDGTSQTNINYKTYDNAGGGITHLSTSIKNSCDVNFAGNFSRISYDLPVGEKVYKRKYYAIFTKSYLYNFIYVNRTVEDKPGGPHPYDYAVLASGKYVWFLARKNTVPIEVFEEMKIAAQNDGVNISSLIVSPLQLQ